MISSNINEILVKNQIDNTIDNKVYDNSFINSLINTKNDENKMRNTDFIYENIRGISLDEIDVIFTNEEDKNLAKNLRLATMFTEDKYLGEALFNTVMGKPFTLGYSYLFDTYEDKHSFFESNYYNSSLSELLYNSVSKRVLSKEDETNNNIIPQEYLDEILLEVNSFNFISSLSKTTKDEYGRYEDENKYSFLYNDYSLKYQELMYKYDEQKNIERNLLNQWN